MSFKQHWKAEESLPRIPAPVLGVKDSLHFPIVLDQVLKLRERQQIRNKAASGKRIRLAAAMTPDQAKPNGKILATQNSLIILPAVVVGLRKFLRKVFGQ